MAQLIKSETGVEIGAPMLRLFIRVHWSQVAAMAHAIHDEPTHRQSIEDFHAEMARNTRA